MKKYIILLASLFVLLGLTACGNSEETNGNEGNDGDEKNISFQALANPNFSKEFYNDAIKRFEEENPEVNIELFYEQHPDESVKRKMATGDTPDVLMNITVADYVKDDRLLPIPVDDKIKEMQNYESAMIDGELYNLHPFIQPQSLVFYNKDLFEEAGIKDTPETWDEFMDVNKQLKENDITPMLTAGGWLTGTVFNWFATDVFGQNPEWYADRFDGEVSFTDENWMSSAKRFQEMEEKEYFNRGALSVDADSQVQQLFFNGEGAMYPIGIWFTAAAAEADLDFDIGVFPMPTEDGSTRMIASVDQGGFAVSNDTEHSDIAIEFAKFMAFDEEISKSFAETDGLISDMEEPITYEMTPLQEEVFEITKSAEVLTGANNLPAGAAPPAGLKEEYIEVAQNLILGKDPKKQLEQLEKYWEQNE